MSKPKLITALHVLTQEEWQSFRKYLLRYTRDNSDNYKCFLKLYDQKKQLMNEGLDEKLRLEHFPQMSPKSFSNLLSRLFTWFEDWFAIETFKNQKHDKALMLVKGYNQRGLFKLADQHFKKFEAKITNDQSITSENQEALSKLYNYQYYSNNPMKGQKNRIFLKDFLDKYLTNMTEQSLILLMELENSSKVTKEDYEILWTIVDHLQGVRPATKLSKILNLALLMIRRLDLNSINNLKDVLEAEEVEESSDLFMILSILLKKNATSLWHKGLLDNPNIVYDALNLSLLAIDKNANQKLLPQYLFNGVESLAMLMTFQETEAFITYWIDKVHTTYKSSTLRYCHALNAFRHEEYDRVPSLMSGLEFDSTTYKLISNSILIIALYKLTEENLVVIYCQNFKKQLKRNKKFLTNSEYTRLKNLTQVILLLQKYKYDKKIKINLTDHSPIYYRSWVIKELE